MSWWCHQMETFSALLAICAGNSPVPGEFPAQRPVMRSFDVFFDLCPSKQLSKQWWGWWFETLSCPLWRHSNVFHQASPITSYFTWPVDELSSIVATLEVLVLKHQITHHKNYPRLAMAQLYMKQRHPNITEVGWGFSKILDVHPPQLSS